MRRFDQPPQAGIRYRNRIGAYAVITGSRGILLTYEAIGEGEWQLPGGGVDPGESPVRALAREAVEETGWRIAVGPRLTAYQRFSEMEGYGFHARKVCLIHVARAVMRIGEPTEPHHVAAWLPVDGALDLLTNAGDRDALCLAIRLGLVSPG